MNTVFRFMIGLVLMSAMSNIYAWTMGYANDSAGNATFGSVTALVNAIKQGQEVKVAQGVTWGSLYSVCDEIVVNTDNSVSCTYTRSISLRSTVLGTNYGFQDDAYHWFSMVNTKGQRDTIRWSVGQHIDRGRGKEAIALQWFVN